MEALARLTDVLCCPRCGGPLERAEGGWAGWRCGRCGGGYPVFGNIPCLVEDPALWRTLWLRRLDDYSSGIEARLRTLPEEADQPDLLPRTRLRLHRLAAGFAAQLARHRCAVRTPAGGRRSVAERGHPQPARARVARGRPGVLRARVPRLGLGRRRVRRDAGVPRPPAAGSRRAGGRVRRGRCPAGGRAAPGADLWADLRARREPRPVPGRGSHPGGRDGRAAGVSRRSERRPGGGRPPQPPAAVRGAGRVLAAVRGRLAAAVCGRVAGRRGDGLVHRRRAHRRAADGGGHQPRAASRRPVVEPGAAPLSFGAVAVVHDRGGARAGRRQRLRGRFGAIDATSRTSIRP